MRPYRNPFVPETIAPPLPWRVRQEQPPDTWLDPPPIGGGYRTNRVFSVRLQQWLSLVVLTVVILGARTVYLQIYAGTYYRTLAEGNRVRLLTLPAQRGMLYDRTGIPLVRDDPDFQLFIVPVDIPRADAERRVFVAAIAGVLGQSSDQVAALLQPLDMHSYAPVRLAEHLSYQQAQRIAILSGHYPTIRLEIAAQRTYLQAGSLSLSHVLGYLGRLDPDELSLRLQQGYVSSDTIGKSGVELSLESILRGRPGREHIEVDATGRRKEIIAYEEPMAGSDVRLTIDAGMQQALERALSSTLASHQLRRGAAVAMDPNSGAVFALVSLPAFDNNWFARGITPDELAAITDDADHPLFNRAIQGTYPAGSTVKPVIAAAALQEKIITERTTVVSTGGIRVNQWFFPDWKAGGHGPTNVTLALAESVNTFFYYVGGWYKDFVGLGVERLTSWLRQAGLGQTLGIELPGEVGGLVPDAAWRSSSGGEPWYIGDTYHLSIGQGDLLVTPLQVASYTSLIANGGTLYRPHLVSEVRVAGAAAGVSQVRSPIRSNVFDRENILVVKRGLRQTVRSGSARALNALPVAVAGKTGTAQWSSAAKNHAWFTGYAPADDPQVVVTVLVEEGGEGSTVAVPVAEKFFQWWAQNRASR